MCQRLSPPPPSSPAHFAAFLPSPDGTARAAPSCAPRLRGSLLEDDHGGGGRGRGVGCRVPNIRLDLDDLQRPVFARRRALDGAGEPAGMLDRVLVVGQLVVQAHVQPRPQLVLGGDDWCDEVDEGEDEVGHGAGVEGGPDRRAELFAEEGAAAPHAVDALVGQAAQQRAAQQAARAMHAPHVEGIVELEGLAQLDGGVAPRPRHAAHQEGGPRPDVARGAADGGQPTHQPDARAHQAGLAGVMLLDGEPGEHAGAGRDARVGQRVCRHSVRLAPRSAVEAAPAEPQDAHAERDEGAVVGGVGDEAVVLRVEVAASREQHGAQRRPPRSNVHHNAPREVPHAPLEQVSVR
mmetsp:Transcript_85910/g.229178  ORF Transcript_85910/g.229178 Transcript_85910/m.229178 type:complete len:350 (-) Transcript_85910:588-1637(-)